ncbi:MAG: tripartite tricarboxylate transporter substrate binding protein, partial [Pseudomonadota bacterium]
VINVGGHYSIGVRQVKDAKPDGYNFLLIHMALMGGEAGGFLDFGYRDFEPVAATSEFCVLPVVRKDSGITSVKQLLQKAKTQPDSLIFGANLGALNHMGGIMLQDTSPGSKFRFVQIGGGTANFTALTGGQTNTTVLGTAEVMTYALNPDGTESAKSKIRPLAYTGSERHPSLPNIPTMKEEGFDMEYCISSWWFAPKGTPQEAIDGLANALERAATTDRVIEFYAKKLFAPKFLKGPAFKKNWDDTWVRIQPVAQTAKQK